VSVTRGPQNNESLPIDFTSLTEYQDEFLRGDKRYLSFISGVGAGKTYAGIFRTFLNMEIWNPGEMGAIVAPTRQMVVNVIIPEMREIGLMDIWEYNSSYSDEPGIHSPNGSRALILSADNSKTVERLRGLNLSWGYIDERTAVPDRAKEILLQRLRTGQYRNLFETTTPKGKDGTYDFYVGDVDATERPFDEATVYETDDRLAIVGVPTRANPELPDDYQSAMEQDMPDEIRAQEVEGQFIEIGGGVFKTDMFSFIEQSDIDENYTLEYILGIDPATQADAQKARDSDSDFWAATLIALHRNSQQIYVVDAKRKRGMSLSQGVSWIADIADQVPNPSLAVESNQSQRWLRQELAAQGYSTINVQSTRDKEERLIDLSIPIENDQIKFINHSVDDNLGYDSRWQTMIQEFLSFPDGSHDDQIDSLHLAVDNANISTNSILSADPYDR